MRRNPTIDIVKGIAILSVVIGHGSYIIYDNFKIGPFVYSYHLMVFMFVIGLCYDRNRYASDIKKFLGAKLWAILPLYIVYNTVFVLLHNFLVDKHVEGGEIYNFSSLISAIAKGVVLQTDEGLLGALWFLGMMLVAEVLFGTIVFYASKFKLHYLIEIIISVILACAGLYLIYGQVFLPYHIQVSLLAVPFIFIGSWVRYVWEKIDSFFEWYIALICSIASAFFLYILVDKGYAGCDLSADLISNYRLFYPTTLLGIFFCLSMAEVLKRIPVINRLFEFAGRNSFHIMALHFLVFKLFDGIYGRLNFATPEQLVMFPHTFDTWWVYYNIGFLIPLLGVKIYDNIIGTFLDDKHSVG